MRFFNKLKELPLKSLFQLISTQKFAGRALVILILLANLLAFQNCAKGFQAQQQSGVVDLDSQMAPVPTCSPTQSQACEANNGHGIQFCTANGVPQTCQLESCNSGYSFSNGVCTAIACTPGSTGSCQENNGSGVKTCNSQGTAFGSCVLNACNAGYHFSNGDCMADTCTPNAVSACMQGNGTGTHICNAQGTDYGACTLSSCNAGYNLQNGSCVQNSCTPNSTTACSENNGSGSKKCNSTGTGFGACVLNTCSTGYNLQGGVCVANVCTPNTTLACSRNNGTGTQLCNASGTGYGTCALSACNPGYNLQNGTCVANPTTPPSSKAVDVYAHFNSLHNHASGQFTPSTNVGNWIARMTAQASGGSRTYTLAAEFGFFNQWTLPPSNKVPHAEVSSPYVASFSASWSGAQNIDVVEFVPDNFDGYGFDPAATTNMGASYQTVLLRMIDQWEANAPNSGRRYVIYAGWPQLNSYGAGSVGALTAPQIATWITFGLGTYQNWMELLVSRLKAARPGLDIRLHNVSKSVLIAYRDTVVRTIPATTLFEDLAPHGRASWYFLAAVADYIALYGEKPPANFNFDPAWGVSPVITANYQAIVDAIWNAR